MKLPAPLDFLPAPPPYPPVPWGLVKDDGGPQEQPEQSPPPIERPGCTAADEAIVALGHLDGLSRGLGGFGVLRVSKQRLETGAMAAEQLGHNDLAAAMKRIAGAMPDVHTEQQAGSLAEELRPIVDQCWSLGARCKGHLSSSDIAKAKDLARRVKDGTISIKQAVQQMKSK